MPWQYTRPSSPATQGHAVAFAVEEAQDTLQACGLLIHRAQSAQIKQQKAAIPRRRFRLWSCSGSVFRVAQAFLLVEPRRIELLTSSLRTTRSPN
jgi:hypothetical protein